MIIISDMIGTALKSLITASEYDDVLKSAVILCLMLKDLFVMPDTVSVIYREL